MNTMEVLNNGPKHIDFNAQHVVFLGDDGKVYFAAKSSGYHFGRKVLGVFGNFESAYRYVRGISGESSWFSNNQA